MNYPGIRLKEGKEKSLLRYHRWIFSGAIDELPDNLNSGDWVEVFSARGQYLATGYYQDSNIAVRIVSFLQMPVDNDFWIQKIKSAYSLREKLGYLNNPSTNCFRLLNGEGDELPGLIVDYYGGTAVIQSHSEGIRKNADIIAEALKSVLKEKLNAIYHKPSFMLNNEEAGTYLLGIHQDLVIMENDLRLNINLEQGQKTGYFLDQRENRFLSRRFTRDAKVLDAFCYAGGFSLNALKGGASHVDAIDIAPVALQLTSENLKINGFEGKFELIGNDVLKFLLGTTNTYDVIILDPPAFAKHLSSRHNAIQGYKRLNSTALEKINKGGFLFTFSCSQVVDKKLFENTIMAAAIEAGRLARIVERMGQPSDHPVNIFHPESEYLKGLVLEVE